MLPILEPIYNSQEWNIFLCPHSLLLALRICIILIGSWLMIGFFSVDLETQEGSLARVTLRPTRNYV